MQRYKKIVITGANSFLGTNVAMSLCAQGVQVRAIVRHSNKTLDSLPIEIVNGTPIDFADLSRAAAGCDCIVHIAAITDQSLLRYEHYRDFNVKAIENVIAVARATNIHRVVFVSSANAIGNGTADAPATETTPLAPPYSAQLYGRSKVEAEQVLKAATDIESVIVNPTFMIGAHDSKPSSGEMIVRGYRKRIIFATPGGKNIVDVKAAAAAICNAIENGKSGHNYLLSGVNMSIKEFYKFLAKVSGKKALIIVVPRFLLVGAGYCGDVCRAIGIRTRISSVNMKVLCEKEYYSGEKATAALGLSVTSVEQCVSEAIDWFVENDMV